MGNIPGSKAVVHSPPAESSAASTQGNVGDSRGSVRIRWIRSAIEWAIERYIRRYPAAVWFFLVLLFFGGVAMLIGLEDALGPDAQRPEWEQ